MAEVAAQIGLGDLAKVDIRAGRVLRAEEFPQARKPAIKLWIDFGSELGQLRSSAQITDRYTPQSLTGRMVLAVVNLPPRQIGPFLSEVLVLGLADAQGGIVLIGPDDAVPPGERLQ